jgi:hypothetical protein
MSMVVTIYYYMIDYCKQKVRYIFYAGAVKKKVGQIIFYEKVQAADFNQL